MSADTALRRSNGARPRSYVDSDDGPVDAPFSGKPLRNKGAEADPAAVLATKADPAALTGRGRIFAAGSGDLRRPVDRAGSRQDAALPSRRGDRLFYADGRVTDLDGQQVVDAGVPRASLPDSVDAQSRIRRILRRD
jgi:hypothetical protein